MSVDSRDGVTAAQINECREVTGDYFWVYEDAAQRMKKGQRQLFCTLCERWKWKDKACEMAALISEKQHARLYAEK